MNRRAATLLCSLAVVGCVTTPTPAAHLEARAAAAGYQRLVLVGGDFHHVAYRKGGSSTDRRLHVYLEGDGRPWIGEQLVAADPHPRRALAFELMQLDPAPSLYLGRPCYNRWRQTDDCDPLLWTLARYSPRVVAAMEQALLSLLAEPPVEQIVLVGYSGGGVLAMLLAERLPKVRAVVTLAANLDLVAWADLHHYTPLLGSLDPSRRPPLPASIRQLHLLGEDDERIPPDASRRLAELSAAELVIYPGFDHSCCWSEIWPDVLAKIASQD